MNRIRIIARVLLMAVVVWGFYRAILGDWFLLQTFISGFALGLPVLFILLPFVIKRALVSGYSSPSRRLARADEFALLNSAELEQLTREWEALGFVQRSDEAGGEATPKLGIVFSRVMEHQTEGALVEIAQQFLPTKVLPLFSSVISFWGESERAGIEQSAQRLQQAKATASPLASPDGSLSQAQRPVVEDLKMWTLVTHNRAPNRLFTLLRHPRVLAARLEKNASPAQLWQIHQERVALVNARLGATPLRGDLPALLRAHAQVLTALTLVRLKATSVWKIARVQFFSKAPAPIFDGELAPLNG